MIKTKNKLTKCKTNHTGLIFEKRKIKREWEGGVIKKLL